MTVHHWFFFFFTLINQINFLILELSVTSEVHLQRPHCAGIYSIQEQQVY